MTLCSAVAQDCRTVLHQLPLHAMPLPCQRICRPSPSPFTKLDRLLDELPSAEPLAESRWFCWFQSKASADWVGSWWSSWWWWSNYRRSRMMMILALGMAALLVTSSIWKIWVTWMHASCVRCAKLTIWKFVVGKMKFWRDWRGRWPQLVKVAKAPKLMMTAKLMMTPKLILKVMTKLTAHLLRTQPDVRVAAHMWEEGSVGRWQCQSATHLRARSMMMRSLIRPVSVWMTMHLCTLCPLTHLKPGALLPPTKGAELICCLDPHSLNEWCHGGMPSLCAIV